MRIAGLFAGIGGLELGMHRSGHTTELLCDVLPAARAVLNARFPGVPYRDETELHRDLLPVGLGSRRRLGVQRRAGQSAQRRERFESGRHVGGRVGVHGAAAALVAGVQGGEQVGQLSTAHLADH